MPVDFEEASAHAVLAAGSMAKRFGARVHLLHAEALEAPPYFTVDQVASLRQQRITARAKAKSYLAGFGRAHGVEEAEVVIQEGPPASVILSNTGGKDLVVMGTHGRHGPSRWWLGSVAERVVHESMVPALVVRDGSTRPPETMFERVLVVAAGQSFAEHARRVSEGLATAFGGSVAEQVARCEGDLARHRSATLIVVARSQPGDTTERWLRNCSLPMLFVPPAGV